MLQSSVRSNDIRFTRNSILALIVLIVVLAFATVSVFSVEGAGGNNYDQTITYHYDSSDSVSPVNVGYYGIAATEYNPEYWSGTGNIGSNTENWVGPLANTVTETISEIHFKADKGIKNVTYLVKFPNTHTIESVTPDTGFNNVKSTDISISSDRHSFTYKQTDGNRISLKITFSGTISITPNKVFAGWKNTAGELILPGDVVENANKNKNLTAEWITPDIFVLKQDWINWSYNQSSANNPILSTTVEALSAYANIGFVFKSNGDKDGKMGVIDYDDNGYLKNMGLNEDGSLKNVSGGGYGNYSVIYSKVIHGDGRTSPDMFGTIYHLTCERTKEKVFYTNLGAQTNYPNGLTAGSYRTPVTDNALTPILMFNESKRTAAQLNGNTIIDNVTIAGGLTATHGDSSNAALFANGHILIMGTNITNPNMASSGDLAIGAPQIFGGKNGEITATAITEPVLSDKKIVFGDSRTSNLTVNLGTCVIIHSGLYLNVMAGGFSKCDIGTSVNPLSTYLILKGGSTIDTVAGGNGGSYSTIYGTSNGSSTNDTENTGGAFIYAIDYFMPGDDWEDKQSGCYTEKYGRTSYSIVQSSIMEGGHSKGNNLASQSIIYGSTHIFLTGTSSVWDVQAGGRSGYTHADTTYLEITGKAVVRHVACGTITDGAQDNNNCVDHAISYVGGNATVANLYGAGYDTTYYPNGKSMTGGSVKVTVAGGKVGNVYGGGYRGSIGDETDSSKLKVKVIVTGGEIFDSIYGGGSGGLDKVRHKSDGTFATSTISKYNMSMGRSYVYGNISVTVSGNSVIHGNVYGGGMSVPKLSSYTAGDFSCTNFNNEEIRGKSINVATVVGDVMVTIDGASIDGSVFGGGRGVEFSYVNYQWQFYDYTKAVVVDTTKLGQDDPFFKIPWIVSSSGNYTYTYDTSTTFLNATGSKINGGSYLDFAKINGNASVFVKSGTVGKDVYGGGAIGKVTGSTVVQITGGTINGNVFGGGLGLEDIVSVTGSRGVYVTGSTTRIKGSVYGSSSKGDDGPKDSFHIRTNSSDSKTESYSDSVVVIDQAIIDGSVFGGGFMGDTWGSTYVYVGYSFFRNANGSYSISEYEGESTKTIQLTSIYAGGNISSSTDDETLIITVDPFSTDLVQGHGTVRIFGNGDRGDIRISGSIMGSGNACNTAMSTSIEILNLIDRSQLTGIHRADEVLISQSSIDISGRSTVTDTKTASLYNIGVLTLKNDTSLSIFQPADNVGELHSINRDNNPTTPGSPSNTLTFTGGATFYVRSSSTDFGLTTGFIILTIQNQSTYGAYVLCRSDSPGGFLVTKEGTYKSADKTLIDEEVVCWFIGGTEKKVVTMNLKASTDYSTQLASTNASVDIVKMSNDTFIQYTGGTFTSNGSDSSGHDYQFVTPGISNCADDHQFGLIFGTDAATSDLVARTSNSFSGISGLTNGSIRSAYLGCDTSSPIYFDAGNDQASGAYKLNINFSGRPQDTPAYIGYVTLDFQEVSIIYADGESFVMPMNYIEVRIDLYILTSNSDSAFNTNYTIKVKTEEEDGTYSGYSEILIPATAMSELKLDSITIRDSNNVITPLKNETIVRTTAVMNQDNTSGWMTSSSVMVTGPISADGGSGSQTYAVNKTVGILSGSAVASIRYYVSYTDADQGDIILNFSLKVNDNLTTHSTITLKLSEKAKVDVVFNNISGREDTGPVTQVHYYGSKLTLSQCPDAGDNFVGWYMDSSFTTAYNHDSPLSGTSDGNGGYVLNLYARYMYTVTFDHRDGTTSKLYLSQEGGETRLRSDMMPTPTRAGYIFGGWYKETDFEEKWNPTYDTVSGNITLYAKWTGSEVKVNFYYEKNGQWAKFTHNSSTDYVMKISEEIVNNVTVNVPHYATVAVGSTFNTIDPSQSTANHKVSILDYAQQQIMAELVDQKFIKWLAYSNNDMVNGREFAIYNDVVLSTLMVDLQDIDQVSGLPEINLYAMTSNIAIQIIMDKNTTDATAIVTAPSKFYVYPDGPESLREISGVWKDSQGNEYLKKTDGTRTYFILKDNGTVRFYPDNRGSYYMYDENVLEAFQELVYDVSTTTDSNGDKVEYITERTATYYMDKYGNVWELVNKKYVFIRSTIYTMDGETESSVLWKGETDFPSNGYYKDIYGNRYHRDQTTDPSINDTFTCFWGSEYYYSFTYTLNDATRSGYRLTAWHNDYITDPLYPRPGSERTAKVFVDTDGYMKRAVLEAIGSDGSLAIRSIGSLIEGNYSLSNTNEIYSITYKAEWLQLDYTITINGTENGDVDAFIVNMDGTRTHISGNTATVHYGDVIDISYTPKGTYQFDKWVTTGECIVEDSNSSTTTITVTGNCAVNANDIGDRLVTLTVIYDGNNITDEELDKTRVVLYNTTTHLYYSMDLKSGRGTTDSKIYRNYVPLGNYNVHLLYGTLTDYEEYTLQGDIAITKNGKSSYTYYVISASIADSITIGSGNNTQTYTSNMDAVISYTKYVGAQDSLIFGQSQELIINNPEGHLPTVDITISSGYEYTAFEGFTDVVNGEEVFILNTAYNYYTGKTDTLDNGSCRVTKSFHLNWTNYDKPASIIVSAKKLSYTVTYALYNSDKTAYTDDNVAVTKQVILEFGDTFISKIPTEINTIITKDNIARTIGGWYFDSNFSQQILGFNALDDSMITQAKNGMVIYGKVVNGEAKNVQVEMQFKNIDEDGYTTEMVVTIPLMKHTDGTYHIDYKIREVSGMSIGMTTVPSGFTTVTNGDVISITASSSASWPAESTPRFIVQYERKSVNISINPNSETLISSGAWEAGKTAVFEETVKLPTMLKNEYGVAITGWNSEPQVTVEYKSDGYYYKVAAGDTGKNIVFTPVYPEKKVTVTFITPIGTINETGNTRYEQIVNAGNTVGAPTIANPDPASYTGYAFYAADNETTPFDFGTKITDDITLIAKWNVVQHTFSYSASNSTVSSNLTDGNTSGPFSLGHRTEVILTIIPDLGYDLDIDGTISSNSSGVNIGYPTKLADGRGYSWSFFLTADLDLSIVTKTASADISFFVNGKKIDASDTTTMVSTKYGNEEYYGKNIPLYTTVTFTNYNGGSILWYTEPEMNDEYALPHSVNGNDVTYTLTVKENISLYTTSNNYQVFYHNYDDTVVQGFPETSVDNKIQLRDITYEKSGYIFVGWAVKDGNNRVYAYKPQDTITADQHTAVRIDLYAYYVTSGNASYEWDGQDHHSSIENTLQNQTNPETLEIHYSKDTVLNGTNYNVKNSNESYVYSTFGSSITFKDAEAHLVYFYGIIKGATGSEYEFGGTYTINIYGNHLLSFYNGDVLVEERRISDVQTVGTLPTLPVRDDARFNGWYIGDSKLESTKLGSELKSLTIVKAKWDAKHTVTFDSSGGTSFNAVEVFDGEKVSNPGTPERTSSTTESYTFKGWYSVVKGVISSDVYNFDSPVTSDLDLIAVWEAEQAKKIAFYSQSGGPNSTPNLVVTIPVFSGQKVPEKTLSDLPSGMKFLGWREITLKGDTISEGYEYTYTDASRYYDFDSIVGDTGYNLLATWAPYQYTIQFDLNGGTGSMPDKTSSTTVSKTKIQDSDVKRVGYDLQGWSLTRNGTVAFDNTEEHAITGKLSDLNGDTITLYAVWKIKTYTVSFNPDNETGTTQQQIDHGKYAQRPANPEKTGNRFLGWYLNDQLFDVDNTPITSDVNLIAKWIEQYTVTFDSRGGTPIESQIVDKGSLVSEPADPTKIQDENNKYTFGGWFVTVSENNSVYDRSYNFNEEVTGDLTLKALWVEHNAHTVTFYSVEGGEDPEPRSSSKVYDGDKVTAPNDPQGPAGLTFTGWYEFELIDDYPGYRITSATSFDFANTEITKDYILIPGWYTHRYTIVFDTNNGTGSVASINADAFESGMEFNDSSVKRTGYHLAGWSLEKDGDVDFTDTITRPLSKTDGVTITLYAKWIKIHDVTFQLDATNSITVQVLDGDKVSAISTIPEKDPTDTESYEFSGWSLNGSTEYNFDAPVTQNIVLTPLWDITPRYVVSFYGIPGGTTPVLQYSVIVTKGSTVSRPANPETPAGLIFRGWYGFDFNNNSSGFVMDETEFDFTSPINTTTNIITKWESFTYTIEFNVNGGTGSINNMTSLAKGEPTIIPNAQVSKTGYHLLGWSRTENGEVQFTNKISGVLSNKDYAIITLYAVWEINSYTVKFVDSDIDDQIVNHGEHATEPDNVTKASHRFVNWYADEKRTKVFDFNTPITNDTLVYAKWIRQYTVTFEPSGGTMSDLDKTMTVDVGSTISKQPEINRAAIENGDSTETFTFKGWYVAGGSSSGTEFVFGSTKVESDLTLIARWSSTNLVQIEYYSNVGGGNNIDLVNVDLIVANSQTTGTVLSDRSGMHFEGWTVFTADDNGVITKENHVVDFNNTTFSTNTKLMATWSSYVHTVEFNQNYGDNTIVRKVEDYKVSTSVITWSEWNLSRAGYSLKGWSLSSTGDAQYTESVSKALGNAKNGDKVTLYAIWDIVEYDLTLNYNEGQYNGATIQSKYTVETDDIILPTAINLQKVHYTFKGWYDNSDFTGNSVTKISKGSTGDKSLYAKWDLTEYLITFITNNGTFVSENIVPTSYTFQSSDVTLPTENDISRTGYSFAGWYDNKALTGNAVQTISGGTSGDKMYYAKWNVIDYHITFKMNDGLFGNEYEIPTSYNIESETITLPTADKISREGYDFKGWYIDNNLSGDPITKINKNSTGDKIFYAKWTPVEYKITYNTEGGEFSANFTPVSKYSKETATFSVPTSADISKTGYNFNGWSNGSETVTQVPSGSTGDMILTAQWSIVDYSISYNLNGGQFINGYTNPNSYNIESSDITLPTSSEITRKGFTFLGWYDSSATKGATKIIYHGSTGNRTFTAQWAAIDYLINYIVDGGVYSEGYRLVTEYNGEDENVILPTSNDITREGHDFLGWFEDGSETNLTQINSNSAKNYTIYAKWQIKNYTVKIVPDNGTVIEDQSVTYNQCAKEPAGLVKDGFRFMGWFSDQALTESFGFETPIKDNITIYAKWIEEYTVSFDTDGGNAIQSQKVIRNGNVAEPANPTKDLHRFLGWSVDSAPFSFDTPITSDITITAKWIRQYTVSFDSNGGTTIGPQTVDSGSSATTPINPQRDGYTFKYWHVSGQSSAYDFTSPITGDVTLIAQWESNYTPTPVRPPSDPTPIDPTPVDPSPDDEKEIIDNDDGSQTVIEKKTEKDEDGNTTETITETTTKQDGSKTEDISKTVTNKDGSKESLDQHTVTDGSGNVIERDTTISITDPSGKQDTIVVKGDGSSIRIIMPDTEMKTLYKAIEYVSTLNVTDVTLEFDSDLGYIIIPAPYLDEVSKVRYHICLVSKVFDITIDRDVVSYLSEDDVDAKLWIHEASIDSLTDEQRRIVGDNYVLYLALDLGDRHISELNGFAHIIVSTEKPYNHAYHVTDDGQIEEIDCSYDKDAKNIEITLSHFSIYTMTVGPLEAGDGDDSSWILMAAIGAVAIVALLIAVVLVMRKL